MRSSSVLALLATISSASAIVVELESGTPTGDVHVAKDVAGYTGTGYITGFAVPADTVTISVPISVAGSYDLSLVYSAPYGDKYTTVNINGGANTEVAIPNITTTTWSTSTIGTFSLPAGTNTVKFTNDWGYYFLDSISVVPTPAKPIVVVDVTNGGVVEIEDGVFTGVQLGTTPAGFSGKGFVQGFDAAGDQVLVTIFSKTQKLYNVVLRYAAIYGGKQTTMTLNGATGAEIVLADTTTAASPWANATAGQILLNPGNNTITFSLSWGWYFLDALYITPSPAPAPHQVPNSLVDSKALPVTKALFSKLLSQYGTGNIFSGQSELLDIAWLEKNVGKTPAIGGFDFINYSPSRVLYQGNISTAVEDAMSFDARNGMVAFQWHWNAPKDLVNNATVLWWQGIYTYGTTFNLTGALANPSGADYAILLSDMDAIAYQLLRLQAANIPILWRPLHEAEGGWFWWGAWGPESCKTLWRIMYNRYTTVHNLHNLIWVWNSVNPAWYPGDDVVDILGYDSYPAIGDHGPVSTQYQQLIALGKDKKLVTLPEVGNIPDPALLKLYHADWSYFVTWNSEYIQSDTYNSLAFKKQLYNDPTVLKLTDLGNWKGSATGTTTSKVSSTTSKISSTSTTSKITTTLITTSSSTIKPTSTTSKVTITTTSSAPAATQTLYGQCGGKGWGGPTVCATGSKCVSFGEWYSQCQ